MASKIWIFLLYMYLLHMQISILFTGNKPRGEDAFLWWHLKENCTASSFIASFSYSCEYRFSFKVCKNWCKTYEKDVIAFSLMFTAICAFNDLVMKACLHGFWIINQSITWNLLEFNWKIYRNTLTHSDFYIGSKIIASRRLILKY